MKTTIGFLLVFLTIDNLVFAAHPGVSEVDEVPIISGSSNILAEAPREESNHGPRRSFSGFSIVPPYGIDWMITQKGRTSIFLLKRSDPEGKHTVVAFAQVKTIKPKLESFANLFEVVEKIESSVKSDRRFVDYTHDISTVRVSKTDCIKSSFFAEDHGVPYDMQTKYQLTGYSLYCLHPESFGKVVVIGYSQRYPKRSKPLNLENEIQQFVDSILFESLSE